MYSYPSNLKQKATLWLWRLNDLIIICAGAVVSVLFLTGAGFYPPLVMTAVFAFLTIRFEDAAILDFIRNAAAFFFLQQYFEWEPCYEPVKNNYGYPAKNDPKAKDEHQKAYRPERNHRLHR